LPTNIACYPEQWQGDALPFGKSPRECAWCKDTGASTTGYLGIVAMGTLVCIDYGLLGGTNSRGIKGGQNNVLGDNFMPGFLYL
jgi:hypothetical protein